MTEFERVVRALAAIEDPTVADRDYSPSGECGLCDASDGPQDYDHWLDDPMRHEESCPWRMARLLIAQFDGSELCSECRHQRRSHWPDGCNYAECDCEQFDGPIAGESMET